MHYRKHGLKALGLCLVAGLALMAFTASAAQATWKVNGVGIGAVTPAILGHQLGVFELLSSVGAIKVEIRCELLEVHSAYLKEPLELHATLLASKNCKTFLNLVENAKCAPLEPIAANAKGRLILHNGTTYLLVEPLTAGQPFTTLHLGLGTCSIGLNFPITGSFVAECVTVACNVAAEKHPIRVVLPGLFPNDTLQFGTNVASLHGEISLHLGNPNPGSTWNGVG